MFKILYNKQIKNRHPEWPDIVSVEFFKKYVKNQQLLERLNKRGGLSPLELHGAINGMTITQMLHDPINEEDAMYFILEELERFNRNGGSGEKLR